MKLKYFGIKHIIIFFLTLSFFSSCEDNPDLGPSESLPESELTVLFQYEYVNWAWGYNHNGWFIDDKGNRMKYEITDRNTWHSTDNDGYISKEDLFANYAKASDALPRILQSTVTQNAQLIEGTLDGAMSDSENRGADMGSFAWYCYFWDNDRQAFKRQLLAQTGDWTQHNTLPQALTLTAWLKTLSRE